MRKPLSEIEASAVTPNDERGRGKQNGRPKRRRTKVGDLEHRREEIIAAATRIFARQGYQGAAFAAVAEEAGLSLPGLLHYFPRKVDLMLAVLDARDRDVGAIITDFDGNWRGFLAALRKVVAYNASQSQLVAAFSILNAESLAENHPAHALFRERSARVHRRFVDVLRAGQAAGELKRDFDADEIAAELFALMDGLQIWWLRMPESVAMPTLFGAYLDRLERDIAT